MSRRSRIAQRAVLKVSAFISVQEAATELGISAGLAYRLANEFLTNGGRSGIPCTRLGRRLLVSREGVARLISAGLVGVRP